MLKENKENSEKVYKFLIFIVTFYITILLAPLVLVHKIIVIKGYITSSCVFMFPLSYTCMDIIAEIYGYKIARQTIWSGITAIFIFCVSVQYLSKIPSPTFWPYQTQYELVLGNLVSIAIGTLAGTIIGSFLNVYFILKWKILMQGRYFWLRSLGSTFISEAVFTAVSVLIVWIGRLNIENFFTLMFTLFLSKVICSFVMVIPATIIVKILKKAEKYNSDDTKFNFNPFGVDDSNCN